MPGSVPETVHSVSPFSLIAILIYSSISPLFFIISPDPGAFSDVFV